MSRSYNQQLKGPHGLDQLYPMNMKNDEARRILSSFIGSDQWNRAKSEREQVILAQQICNDEGVYISQYDIAQFFGIERSSVQYHIKQGMDMLNQEMKPIGRPSLLTAEERMSLVRWIKETYRKKYPATYQTVADYISDQFHKDICLDTIRHMISGIEELKVVTGHPMENERIFCQPEKIDQYFDQLEEILKFGIPPEFIINIDESGFQEWVDARRLQCIVPADCNKSSVKIPRDRSTKKATLLGGICAYGSTIRPMVIISRETIEKELLDLGYTPDKVMYGRSDTGFMNQTLFLNWAKNSFIPEMRIKRNICNYDGPILLIMDGFGVHDCDQFRSLLDEENIHPLLFAPHSSDQTQFLDLLIFGLQKQEIQKMRLQQDLNWQTKQVVKILDSWRKVTVPRNIIMAFKRGGLIVEWNANDQKLVARLDRSFAKCVRHFQNCSQERSNSKERIWI